MRKSSKLLGKGARNLAVGLGAAFGARAILRSVERMDALSSKLRAASEDTEEFKRVQAELFAISARGQTDVSKLADTYHKFSVALEGQSFSSDRLLKLTETLNQAAVLSGASAETANQAFRQLSQSIAGGIVRAEEYNSIVEGVPVVAQSIAKGLGVTVGEMRNLVTSRSNNGTSSTGSLRKASRHTG